MNDLFDSGIEEQILTTIFVKPSLSYYLLRLSDKDFYINRTKQLFRAARSVLERNAEPGFMATKNELIARKQWDEVGDPYLGRLMKIEPDVRGIETAVERLLDYSLRRDLVDAYQFGIDSTRDMRQITDIVYDVDSRTAPTIAGDAKFGLKMGGLGEGVERFRGRFLKSGFAAFDEAFKGFTPGDLVIMAARPGEGKTTLALQFAIKVSMRMPVYFFSLEMSALSLEMKAISALSGIDSMDIQSGRILPEDEDRFKKAEVKLKTDCNLYIWDNIYNIAEIVSICRRGKEKPGLIVVDYIQLVESKNRERRDIQIGDISRSLKLLGIQLGIPIIGVSQLSRAADGDIPKLSHLRESGSLEQDANMVVFIYKTTQSTFLSVAKYRTGKTGQIEVIFEKAKNRFQPLYPNIDTTYTF
jgi:replicative DNA helicase